jgi:hypothetical protein
MKYLIVDTFNGEGYSDSTHKVKEFESIEECKNYCIDLAKEYADNEFVRPFSEDSGITFGVTYTNDFIESLDELDEAEDHGCIHYQLLSGDEVAVCINPMVNEFWILKSEDEVNNTIDLIKENSADYKEVLLGELDPEDAPFFNHCHPEALCGDGDLIMQRIEQSDEGAIRRIMFQGTEEQLINLKLLIQSGDNDLPEMVDPVDEYIKISTNIRQLKYTNPRVVIVDDIDCYKCGTTQESTQRFCVECLTCLT